MAYITGVNATGAIVYLNTTNDGTSSGSPADAITQLDAGETFIGMAGQSVTIITPTATVSTSPAYTAGDNVGGLLTLTSAGRVSGGAVTLDSLMLLDRANQKPVGTIFVFNANPAAATITDNAAFVFSTDDLKVVAAIPVASTDWVTTNSKATANVRNLGAVLKPAVTTLYAAFVTTSTPTFVATTDVQIAFGFRRH